MGCGEGRTAGRLIEQALHREYFDNHRSLRDCAKIIGISAGFLSSLQTGRYQITPRVAALMEARLGWDGESIWMARAINDYNAALDEVAFDD